MSKLIPLLLISIGIAGCGGEHVTTDPLHYRVVKQDFTTKVPAKGYLEAVTATPINSPTGSRGPQTLAWLAPEYSVVKKGEVVARFEGERLQNERSQLNNDLAVASEESQGKKAQLDSEKAILQFDLTAVGHEKQFSQDYNIDDIRIRSKLDIIDAAQNTEFLEAKELFLAWNDQRFSQSSAGEMALIAMKQSQFKQRMSMIDNNLSSLEVVAPHDGLLTYEANWRGEKPKEGQTLWPGQKIAELPDTSVMALELFVAEREAFDLAVGQTVSFTLNAQAQQTFTATISEVSPFPQSIKRGDPQKFYQVKAALDTTQAGFFPGLKLTASILVAHVSQAITVPSHAVFKEENADFVFLYQQGEYVKQQVEIGQRSASLVEVVSGIEIDQVVSLIAREEG